MPKRTIFLAIMIFLLILILFTFPLFFHITEYIPGFHSSDEPFAVLQRFWWLRFSFLNHYQWFNESITVYPFGQHHDLQILSSLWFHIGRLISIAGSWIIAYNLPMICNFFIAFISMFYLFFYLSEDKYISFFASIIYTLCPYQFSRFWQHYSLVFTGFMPLYILFLIKLHRYRSFKYVFLSTIVFSLLVSLNLHYAFFMFLSTFLFMFYSLIFRQEQEKTKLLKFYLFTSIALMIGSVIVLNRSFFGHLVFAPNNIIPNAYALVRPFEDLFRQSAKPLSYLLPDTAHPIFGKFTEQFIGSPLYGDSLTEHSLYLGWIPLALAFVAIKRYLRQRKEEADNFYAGFFVLLAFMAWIFSQPPWWELGPLKIYMPSFFIYKMLPIFRAYCRFGILVMLAVAVLAGFGLRFIMGRFKTKKSKLALTILFCALVLFEFWNYPPFKVIDVSVAPAVYNWLKSERGNFAIAEYPLDAEGPNEMYKLYQTFHEKKIINGAIPGTYAYKFAQSLKKLSSLETAAKLKGMGVKYAIVHQDRYLESELAQDREELDKIKSSVGLRRIRSFPSEGCPEEGIACVKKSGPVDVYEVIASPVDIPKERLGKS
jgi:hypothetical protein